MAIKKDKTTKAKKAAKKAAPGPAASSRSRSGSQRSPKNAGNSIAASSAAPGADALYRAAIETSADGFHLLDADGRILEVNDAYVKRSGYTRRELLSMHITDLEAKEQSEETAARIRKVSREGSDHFESVHRAKNGTLWPVEVTVSFWDIDGGRFCCFLRDIARRKRSEVLLQTRVRMAPLAERGDLDELLQLSLDTAEHLSGSSIGFFHFMDDDQETLTLQTWSTNTLKKMCTAKGKGSHYPVSKAGVWVDCVAARQPVIHNDYPSLPHRKGMPDGHAPVQRELVVPVLRHDRIVAIMGVGNKSADYDQADVDVVQELASLTMDMVLRLQSEEAMRLGSMRLIDAQEIARLGSWELDPRSGTFWWSAELYRIFAVDPASTPATIDLFLSRVHPADRDALRTHIWTGQPTQTDYRIILPDGAERAIHEKVRILHDLKGSPILISGTAQDVTEWKTAEGALQAAEQKYRSLIDTTDTGYVIIDSEGRVADANQRYADLCGRGNRESVIGRSVIDWTAPYDRERNAAEVRKCMEQGFVRNLEIDYITPDGRTTPVEINATVLRTGTTVSILTLCRDITERKRSENALRAAVIDATEAKAKTDAIIAALGDAISIQDTDYRILYQNQVSKDIYGDHVGEYCYRAYQNKDDVCERCHLTLTFADGKVHTLEQSRMTDQGRRYYDITASPVRDEAGKIIAGIELVRDVTERKRSEAALLKSEENLRKAEKIAKLGNWEWDIGTNALHWSDEVFRIYGADPTRDKPSYDTVVRTVAPEDRDRFVQAVEDAVRNGASFEGEYRMIGLDGVERFTHTVGEVVRDREGRPLSMFGIVRDITKRRELERGLRETKELFDLFLRHSPVYTFIKEVTPTASRVLQASENFREMIGIAGSDMAGKTMADLFPPEFAEKITADDWAVVSRGSVLKLDEELNGRSYTTIKFPLVQGNRTLLAGYTIDITDRKRAEEEVAERGTMLQQIMDTASVTIAIVDKTGRITLANKRMSEMFGRPMDDILGREYVDLVHPAEREIGRNSMLALLRNQVPEVNLERRYIRKDGSDFWGHLACRRLRDARGNDLGLLGVITDITERKMTETALRASEEKFRSIYNNIGIGVSVIDKEMRILSINTQMQKWFPHVDAGQHPVCYKSFNTPPRDSVCGYCPTELTLKDGRTHSAVTDTPTPDGVRHYQIISTPLLAEDGSITAAIEMVEDITERKRTEKEREQFLTFFQTASDIMCIADPNGAFLRTNPACSQVLGYSAAELVSKPFIDFVHPDDKQATLDEMERQQRIGNSLNFENRYLCKDGSVRHLSWKATFNKDEGITYAIAHDITDRKQAEEALRQSEERFRTLLQNVPTVAVQGYAVDGTTQYWNTASERLYGYTAAEAIGRNLLDLIIPEEMRDEVRQAVAFMAETGQGIPAAELSLRRKDGSRVAVLSSHTVVKRPGFPFELFCIDVDLSERKLAEEKLLQSEERFRTLVTSMDDIVYTLDREQRHTGVFGAWVERSGLTPEAFIGRTARDIFSSRLAAVHEHANERALAGESVVYEWSMTGPAGVLYYQTALSPLRDASGAVVGIVGLGRDITRLKETEARSEKNEQFIRSILDTVDEGFIVIDRDYRIVTANKAYCGQVGRPCDDIIGKKCHQVSHGIDRPCYEEGEECAVREVFSSGEPHLVSHKHRDTDGHTVYVETKAYPIKDGTGAVTSVIETITNITEKHLLEEERLKTQKLESIGTLAGGIAHDFNNLLQGIFGYISMAKMTFSQKDRSLAMLEQAEKALHQSVNLTTQLLTFSKGGKPVKKRIDLAPVIENSARFALSGSRSSFRLDLASDLWQTDADEGQIGQVIQNIVLNADQAMPVGGTVSLRARNLSAGSELPPGLPAGDYVEIAIEDTGIGIPEQYLNKIFDPYFTTKEKGSGLGLATSYSIIKNHNGMISVRTGSGKGSTFRIYLPAGVQPPAATTGPPGPRPLTRALKVLLMDDEQLIRELAGELLRALGHDIEVAKHGEEALARYRAAKDAGAPFDVVILDLTVRGGMGGLETLRLLRESDPGVKAIMSSGYSDDASTAEFRKHGFRSFLKKPYDIEALRDTLQALTD